MSDIMKKALEEGPRTPRFADDVVRFRYGDHGIEDWISVAILWVMSTFVFLQFFTRYVLNNSLAWTEEISSYLLITLDLHRRRRWRCARTRISKSNFSTRLLPYRVGFALALLIVSCASRFSR